MKRRKYLGRLITCSTTVPEIDGIFAWGNTFDLTRIVMGEETPTNERQELLVILKDVFAENPKKPNLVTNIAHKIIAVATPPVFRKSFPIPYACRDELNHQLQEMLANDVIRPSNSPWDEPVHLVKMLANDVIRPSNSPWDEPVLLVKKKD